MNLSFGFIYGCSDKFRQKQPNDRRLNKVSKFNVYKMYIE